MCDVYTRYAHSVYSIYTSRGYVIVKKERKGASVCYCTGTLLHFKTCIGSFSKTTVIAQNSLNYRPLPIVSTNIEMFQTKFRDQLCSTPYIVQTFCLVDTVINIHTDTYMTRQVEKKGGTVMKALLLWRRRRTSVNILK